MTTLEELPICSLTRFYLKLSFIWPLRNEKLKWFYVRIVLFITYTCLFFTLSVLMHLFKSLEEGDVAIDEDLAAFAANFGLTLMMVLYVKKQPKLQSLLEDLCDFRNFGKPPGLDQLNRKLDFYAKFSFWYSMLGGVFYCLLKIAEMPKCKHLKKTWEICGLMAPLWTPFDSEYWPVWWFMFSNTFVIVMVLIKITLLVSVQVLEISWHLQLRITHLKSMLLVCFDDAAASRGRLNRCIQYHINIINYSERFNDCFTRGMFVHLATTGVICGCLENQIVKEHQFEAVLHIFGWIASIFVSCLGGQLLMDSSTSVADAAYGSRWYEPDVRTRNDLVLVILRSRKSLFVSTGSFNVLCLALFVSIMRMSYSILTLLS